MSARSSGSGAARRRYPLAMVMLGVAAAGCAMRHAPAEPGHTHEASPPARAADADVTGDQRATVDAVIDTRSRRAERTPADPDAWVALGDAFMQKARETLDAAYYDDAQRAYARSLALDARHVQALVGMAWVQSCRHEFSASIATATQALALDPTNAAAHGLIGDAHLELGNYTEARTHYQAMITSRPDLSSFSRAAHLLHVTGDSRGAIRLLQRAIDSGGPYVENTAWCRAQLALIYVDTGNLVAAETLLADAVARTPDNYHVLFARGRVQAARGDYDAAIESYRRAKALAPQHAVVTALGDVYQAAGRAAEAEGEYRLVDSLHAANEAHGGHGHLELARFYCDHDRELPAALHMAEHEYAHAPSVFAADTLAWCAFKNGRLDVAQRYLPKALSQGTPSPMLYYHAGMIYAAAGSRSEAQRHLYRALSLNPRFDPLAAPHAAETLNQLGSGAIEASTGISPGDG